MIIHSTREIVDLLSQPDATCAEGVYDVIARMMFVLFKVRKKTYLDFRGIALLSFQRSYRKQYEVKEWLMFVDINEIEKTPDELLQLFYKHMNFR